MKVNEAPEKLYMNWVNYPLEEMQVEYTRTDAFIEKALKWYCLDCECNDNCKDIKCFFYREYERYLKGKTNALPPKFSDRILNEDGSTSDNWRYRHFNDKMRNAFIEKACKWLSDNLQTIVNVKSPSKHHVESLPVLGSITQTEFLNKFREEIKFLFD